MDKAIWNEKEIYIEDILKDVDLVSKISNASKNHQLLCPDSHCDTKYLQYCNGDIRTAYFRHWKAGNCDYAKYSDTETKQVRLIRRKLYEHFSKQYEALTEQKIIEHHFTPIIIKKQDDSQLAIDFILNNNLEQTKELLSEYNKIDLPVCFIDIAEIPEKSNVQELSKSKRYILENSKQYTVIAMTTEYDDGEVLIRQYKKDTNSYHNDSIAHNDIYYSTKSFIENLIIVNDEVCLNTFELDFEIWQENKHKKDSKKSSHNQDKPSPQSHNIKQHLTYEELLYNDLSEKDKIRYWKMKEKNFPYPIIMLFLDGDVPRERRDYLRSISRDSKNRTY